MKVALISPFCNPLVEPFPGGTEVAISRLATGLKHRGVNVVCYACEGSAISGVEIRTCGVFADSIAYPRLANEMKGKEVLSSRATEDAVIYQAIEDALQDTSINVIHNHSFSGLPFFLSRFISKPILHTLHLPPPSPQRPAMTEALRACKMSNASLHIVAVSHAHAQAWQPYYPVNQFIYNGLDFKAVPYSSHHNGTLVFAGRIVSHKGIEDAIEIAIRLGKNLAIYGGPQLANSSYFQSRIQPLLQAHSNVTYYGLVDHQTLFQGLCQAQALLFPMKREEPFGYVIVEAMATGTPVIIYDRGSARELVVDDISGYVVPPDDLNAMAAAVERTEKIDRSLCAAYAREKFNIEKSVDRYLEMYSAI